ncbi:MAG: VWA domain-containing protein [Acidobacteria bacterium]|nr:VWA domain-containing protein [Acidobacteriota bacterium]
MAMRAHHNFLIILFCAVLAGAAFGQVGRHTGATLTPSGDRSILLNVVAAREGSDSPVTTRDLSLFDGGMEQTIQSLTPDPGPARIVLLVDNSLGLRADVEKLQQATREFAYEIYEGDQVLVVGYDQQPEIISDWTDDAKKIEAALPTFRKRGEPRLFDALSAVMSDAMRPYAGGNRKRIIVLVADGLDRGSKSQFKDILAELQKQDITVYALQIPDRTGGALRRDKPKPMQVIQQLVEGTGGRILSATEPREAAKTICDELRRNRYVLAYKPRSVPFYETRRLLIIPDEGVSVRYKQKQPAQ